MNQHVADAYDGAAASWAAGAVRVYSSLASAVAGLAPDPSGCRVLDIGAGTGVLGEALLDLGAAAAVAVDVAPGMLARADARITRVVGDATHLPFADGSFDLAASAFCFSHLDDPATAVHEARRTARTLLSASFDDVWTHPAKAVVDRVLEGAGYRAPSWYVAAKQAVPVDNPDALVRLAREAGYSSVDVARHQVDTGLRSPAELADWRLGMAQVAGFTTSLDEQRRAKVRSEVEQALAGMPALVIPVLVLRAA